MASGRPGHGAEFSPVAAAKRVLRAATTGSLATLSPDGAPFASLVTTATTHAGEPILLISRLAVHTQNLARDERAALLLVEPGGEGGDPLAGARLTLTGRIGPAEAGAAVRHRFLARHPEAETYAGFGDFAFHRMVVSGGHLVAGFGRIVDLTPGDLLTNCADASDLVHAEASAIEHMNRDHAEAVSLYATRLLHLPAGPWRVTGVDPEGIDLGDGARGARLAFPQRVTTANALRAMLAELAKVARAGH
jgi:putative heme iron utilization protein